MTERPFSETAGRSIQLSNGVNLNGWRQAEPRQIQDRGWNARDGRPHGSAVVFGPTVRQLLELQVDWRVTKKSDNSGIFVRFPAPTVPDEVVVRSTGSATMRVTKSRSTTRAAPDGDDETTRRCASDSVQRLGRRTRFKSSRASGKPLRIPRRRTDSDNVTLNGGKLVPPTSRASVPCAVTSDSAGSIHRGPGLFLVMSLPRRSESCGFLSMQRLTVRLATDSVFAQLCCILSPNPYGTKRAPCWRENVHGHGIELVHLIQEAGSGARSLLLGAVERFCRCCARVDFTIWSSIQARPGKILIKGLVSKKKLVPRSWSSGLGDRSQAM